MLVKDLREILNSYSEDTEVLTGDFKEVQLLEVDGMLFLTEAIHPTQDNNNDEEYLTEHWLFN